MRAAVAAMLSALLAGCGADWYLQRGEVAVHEMDLVAAERSFRSALVREPDRVEALYGLGWTYHLAGYQEEARETFERCIQVQPQSPLGYKGLGSIALAEGNLDVAQGRFDQALQRAPGETSVLNSMALLHIRAERYEEALTLYEQLRSTSPAQVDLAVGHAETLLRLGRHDESLRIVDQILGEGGATERQETMLQVLRARVLLGSTTGRLDDQRCEETAPPLLTWLGEADLALDRAEGIGLELEILSGVRREVHQRRKLIQRRCPGAVPVNGE